MGRGIEAVVGVIAAVVDGVASWTAAEEDNVEVATGVCDGMVNGVDVKTAVGSRVAVLNKTFEFVAEDDVVAGIVETCGEQAKSKIKIGNKKITPNKRFLMCMYNLNLDFSFHFLPVRNES